MANLLATNGAVPAELQTRLSDPHPVAALTRLLNQADSLANAVESAEGILRQGPGMAAMLTDSMDEMVRQAVAAG